jgi:hypothetical protein
MRSKNIFFLMTVCVLLLTCNCFAQTKSITKKEYEFVQHIAEANIEKTANIISRKIEEYSDGKLSKTSIITAESIPPKKMKWTEVETSGNQTTKLEIIDINGIQYKRENGRTWVKKDLGKSENNGESTGLTISGQESPNRKKYSIEEAKFNEQMVHIYTVSTVYNFDPNIVYSYRRWIDSNNLILKSEDIESEIKSGAVNRSEIAESRAVVGCERAVAIENRCRNYGQIINTCVEQRISR